MQSLQRSTIDATSPIISLVFLSRAPVFVCHGIQVEKAFYPQVIRFQYPGVHLLPVLGKLVNSVHLRSITEVQSHFGGNECGGLFVPAI